MTEIKCRLHRRIAHFFPFKSAHLSFINRSKKKMIKISIYRRKKLNIVKQIIEFIFIYAHKINY